VSELEAGYNMKKKLICVIVLIIFAAITVEAEESSKNCYPITADDLTRKDAPRFDQHPSKAEQIRHPAKVNLKSSAMARKYRTMLRRGVAKGPNFAGHYAVVGWGCGTSCVQFAVVDLKSGEVVFPDDFTVISGAHLYADEFEKDSGGGQFWGLRYKVNSKLLIAIGTLDEDEEREGAFYYLLQKGKLKKIFSVNVQKINCDHRFQD